MHSVIQFWCNDPVSTKKTNSVQLIFMFASRNSDSRTGLITSPTHERSPLLKLSMAKAGHEFADALICHD